MKEDERIKKAENLRKRVEVSKFKRGINFL